MGVGEEYKSDLQDPHQAFGPHPLPNEGAVRAKGAGRPRPTKAGGQKAAAQAPCHYSGSTSIKPRPVPFQLDPRFSPFQGHCSTVWDKILRRHVQKSRLSQRPHLLYGGRPLCSPLLSLDYRIPPHLFLSSHPDHLAHPVPVLWFRLRLRLRLRFWLQGRPSPAQGPRCPPGAHPLIPLPPPFATSPAPGCGCGYRCRGRRGEGRMVGDAGWLGDAAGSG